VLNMEDDVIDAGAWRLRIPPAVTEASPLVCVPTIHPRGDQRVVRVAQATLDAGYRVRFVWPGEGVPSNDPRASERIVKSPRSFRERVASMPAIARHATASSASIWHIHDLYFLPFARRWSSRARKPFIYDVHEHYGFYYASRLRLPTWLSRWAAKMIDRAQVAGVRHRGGVNVVAASMAGPFIAARVPAAVSPNFPISTEPDWTAAPRSERERAAIHVGTLSQTYGTELLISVAARVNRLDPTIRIDLVRRFPNRESEREFQRLYVAHGSPPNLCLIEPVAAHEIPGLLSRYRVGLSTILPAGQNDLAVPTKIYDYIVAGLPIVGTARAAQAEFAMRHGLGAFSDDPDEIVSNLVDLLSTAPEREHALAEKSLRGRVELSWSGEPARSIAGLLNTLHEPQYRR
jgi:hypothetical protein